MKMYQPKQIRKTFKTSDAVPRFVSFLCIRPV